VLLLVVVLVLAVLLVVAVGIVVLVVVALLLLLLLLMGVVLVAVCIRYLPSGSKGVLCSCIIVPTLRSIGEHWFLLVVIVVYGVTI